MNELAHPARKTGFGWPGVAKLTVTTLLLGALLAQTPFAEVVRRIVAVSPAALLACAGLLLLTFVATGVRWHIILEQLGADMRTASAVRYTFIGGFFNQLLPSGMGGDVFRVWYAREFGLSTGAALASVLIDRLLGMLSIVAIVAAGVPAVLWMKPSAQLATAAIAGIVLLASGIALFLSLDAFARPLERLLHRLAPDRIRAVALRLVSAAAWSARSSRRILLAWPYGPIAMALSIGIQLLVGFSVFLLFQSVGQSVAFVAVLYLFAFVQLLSMLPISFAGWGLREGAMVVAFQLAGVPPESALGISILFGLCLLVSSLPGAALWLAQGRRSVSSHRS
jgi:uncharacterized protein (TIRG00374 family)